MKPGPLLAQGRTAEVFAWSEDAILKLYYDWCPPDWMTAHRGAPLADVARTSLVLSYGSPPAEAGRLHVILSLFRRLFHNRYLHEYLALHPGLDQSQVEAWKAPVAAARLCEGIASEKAPLLAYLRQALSDKPSSWQQPLPD